MIALHAVAGILSLACIPWDGATPQPCVPSGHRQASPRRSSAHQCPTGTVTRVGRIKRVLHHPLSEGVSPHPTITLRQYIGREPCWRIIQLPFLALGCATEVSSFEVLLLTTAPKPGGLLRRIPAQVMMIAVFREERLRGKAEAPMTDAEVLMVLLLWRVSQFSNQPSLQ